MNCKHTGQKMANIRKGYAAFRCTRCGKCYRAKTAG